MRLERKEKEQEWRLQHKSDEVENLTQKELIDIILKNRGLKESYQNFINPKHPSEISLEDANIDSVEMQKAINLIKDAIIENKKIVIIGDYDVDGVSSTAILFLTIARDLGYENVVSFIPNRYIHGYGISEQIIDEIWEDEKNNDVGLIITVDNGIVANKAVAYARERNIDVIVTDHHTPDDDLPNANAIVHTKDTSGAGIAWLLARELTADKANEHLDLVFLGVVCDQMKLTGINRSFAYHGRDILRESRKPGIRKLVEIAGQEMANLDTYHAGFVIGPRLNAVGRMDKRENALWAHELLTSLDPDKVEESALVLEKHNTARKEEVDKAIKLIKQDLDSLAKQHFVVVIGEQNEGVSGLIASDIVKALYKPTLALRRDEDGNYVGSARSIEGYDITQALRSIDDDLFIKLGGHEMAAGCTIAEHNLKYVKDALNTHAQINLTQELLTPYIKVDVELGLDSLSFDLVKAIQLLSPFGYGNPQPKFMTRGIMTKYFKMVGRGGTHAQMRIYHPNYNQEFAAIAFNFGNHLMNDIIPNKTTFDIIYKPDINRWNGNVSLQLVIDDIKYNKG